MIPIGIDIVMVIKYFKVGELNYFSVFFVIVVFDANLAREIIFSNTRISFFDIICPIIL